LYLKFIIPERSSKTAFFNVGQMKPFGSNA